MTLKLITITILAFLLLIPLGMINSKINERETYRQEAVASIARSWTGAQVFYTPFLVQSRNDISNNYGIPVYTSALKISGVLGSENIATVREELKNKEGFVHMGQAWLAFARWNFLARTFPRRTIFLNLVLPRIGSSINLVRGS